MLLNMVIYYAVIIQVMITRLHAWSESGEGGWGLCQLVCNALTGRGCTACCHPLPKDKRQVRRTEYTLLGQEDDIVVCCDLLTFSGLAGCVWECCTTLISIDIFPA